MTVARAWLVAVLLVLVAAHGAPASPGPENVLVVVNADSEASVAVAREYARLRRIPPGNVLYLRDVPTSSVISVAEFRSRILTPILETIRSRGLAKQIDCVAYSTGFPYGVDVRADMEGHTFPRYITSPASLTGLTYLHELVAAADPEYLDMQANRYCRGIRRGRTRKPWSEQDRRMAGVLAQASSRLSETLRAASQSPETARQLAEALALAEDLASRHPDNPDLLYDLACLRALKGDADGAMRALRSAVDAGWLNVTHTETDPDLASLRSRADFRALVQHMRSLPVQAEPPQRFRASTRWDANHQPTNGAGRKYLLSAMLAYVGGQANTLEEALACLRRAAAADHTHPRGTLYFMVSQDGARTGPRRWAFESAKAALSRLGVRAEVLDGVLPPSRSDVAGAMIGIATFDWKSSRSTILPGAFCDHLTSFAGAMNGAGQTLLSEWIRYGAAGSSGTVAEPYAIQAKFPTAFLHVYYASGCTLAEAFYQSVSGPYQQLLVGDPLCAPWAPRVQVTVRNLREGVVLRKPLSVQVRCNGPKPVRRYELYINGRLITSCGPEGRLLLDPRRFATGTYEARVVAVTGSLETRGRAVLRLRIAR